MTMLEWKKISLSGSLVLLVLKLAFCELAQISASTPILSWLGLLVKSLHKTRTSKVILELFLWGQIREVCASFHQFRSAGGVWGAWLCSIITETQYLIFLKELSHGFKKPIQALLHTPALNTQRCVLHIYLCHLLSILLNTHFSKIPSWHKHTRLEAKSWCRMASLQGSQLTAAENPTYIHLLDLGHPTALCRTLNSYLHHCAQTCKGNLFLTALPLSAWSLCLYCAWKGKWKRERGDAYSFIPF